MFGVIAALVPQRLAVESSSSCVAGRQRKRTWDQRGYLHTVGGGWMLLSPAAGIVGSTGELMGEAIEAMGCKKVSTGFLSSSCSFAACPGVFGLADTLGPCSTAAWCAGIALCCDT